MTRQRRRRAGAPPDRVAAVLPEPVPQGGAAGSGQRVRANPDHAAAAVAADLAVFEEEVDPPGGQSPARQSCSRRAPPASPVSRLSACGTDSARVRATSEWRSPGTVTKGSFWSVVVAATAASLRRHYPGQVRTVGGAASHPLSPVQPELPRVQFAPNGTGCLVGGGGKPYREGGGAPVLSARARRTYDRIMTDQAIDAGRDPVTGPPHRGTAAARHRSTAPPRPSAISAAAHRPRLPHMPMSGKFARGRRS